MMLTTAIDPLRNENFRPFKRMLAHSKPLSTFAGLFPSIIA